MNGADLFDLFADLSGVFRKVVAIAFVLGILFAPAAVYAAVEWYANQRAAEFLKQIQHVLPPAGTHSP